MLGGKIFFGKKSFASFLQKRRFFFLERKKQRTFVNINARWRQLREGSDAASVRVWDVGIRAFHWALVALVTASVLTGFVLGLTTLAWHLFAGVAIMIALAWRVVWGFLGTTHARFADFAPRTAIVLAHAIKIVRGQHHRHPGHNPMGAMMVFTLLAVFFALGITGAITLGGMLKQGPLRFFLAYATGTTALAVHNLLAILLLILIGFHTAGVVFESWRGRENLVRAMLTGDKRADDAPADSAAPVQAWPKTALAIVLAGLAVAVPACVALTALPGRGVPPAALDADFAEQCGACHLAYPPSLAPASTWNAILGDLEHHFGADASLSPALVEKIHGWLDANAAEHWDTLPSQKLRAPAPDGSRRITDTPGWRRIHKNIPATRFSAAPVYRRGNCAACHADARTGLFAPQAIAIPAAARF
jgi:cytochrome b